MARRTRCSAITDCLFNSNSSTTLANIGPSLPVTVCLLLVTTFFSLSVSRFLVADNQAHITVLVPRIFLVVLKSVAVIFAVAFFVLPTASIVARVRPGVVRASLSRGRLLATFLRQNVVVVGIILFYVISCVPDLMRVINTSMCWQAWTDPDVCTAQHVELFYYSLRVILTSLMVLVCWSFRTAVLRRNLFVTLGLATFAAAMSCLWFDTWVTEVAENLRHARQLGIHQTPVRHSVSNHSHEQEHSYNSTKACQTHNTSIDNLLDKYEQYFYPCTFELALLIVHCVVHWYTSSQTSSSSSLPSRHSQQPTETSALLGYRSTDVTVTSLADVNDVITAETRGLYTMLLVVMTTLVNIVYCLLTFLAVYAQLYYEDSLFYHVRVWYETFYRLLMTSLLIAGLVVAAGTTKRRHLAHHSGVEYLVLFTSWAPVIKSLLMIIAYSCGSRDWITTSLRAANISGQTIAVLQVAVQTVFVFYVRNLRCDDEPLMSSTDVSEWRRRRSQFRAVLLVIVLSDVSFWVNSCFEINMAYGYSYLSNFIYHWVPLVSLIVPVAVFYYFNCALLCLDVFLNC